MATWPSQLPRPQLTGYALQPQAAFARTDMDAGPARQRRRFTQAPVVVPQQFTMTRDQMETFRAWYAHRIDDGATWFTAPVHDGRGLVNVDCRFTEPYSATAEGVGVWLVSCTWEVRNLATISSAALTAKGVL